MSTHAHSHRVFDDEKLKSFVEFIRQVSPNADPTSVLLFGSIHKSNHLLTQAAETQLESIGLSWAKLRMLMELQRNELFKGGEGLQPSELSELQGIQRNSASALIGSLEEVGMISREPHPTDRRKYVIRLSAKGRKMVKSKLDLQFKRVTQYFCSFSDQDRSTLLELLKRLNDNLAHDTKRGRVLATP